MSSRDYLRNHIHVWSQDLLDETPEHRPGRRWMPPRKYGKLWHKRGHVYLVGDETTDRSLAELGWEGVIEGNWRRWSFGWSFRRDDERPTYGMSANLGPVTIYLHGDGRWTKRPEHQSQWQLVIGPDGDRATPFSVKIHYSLGADPYSWTRGQKRRSGVIWLENVIFGRTVYSKQDYDEYDAVIPMPEGAYRVHVTISEATWRRPRWPIPTRSMSANVKMIDPIPEPGNMESDFYNGEDAVYEMGVEAGTPAEVVGRVVGRVMAERLRHGGSIDWRPSEKDRADG